MELDNKIIELKEKINRKYSLEYRLNDLNEQYSYLKEHLHELTSNLIDVDIKSLSKMSIIYVWYEIFTSKGQNISKIEYNYILKHHLIEFLHQELIEVKNKLMQITKYEEEYKNLLIEKEKTALDKEKKALGEFNKLVDEAIKYKNRIRDINNAINTCMYLENAFSQLLDLLKKSKNWDNLDIFGRGLFMTMTKSPIFIQSDERIKKLYYLAYKLVRDIRLLNFYTDVNIDISSFMKFLEYFENNLYNDIKDKKRIFNIIDYLKDCYKVINKILNDLKTKKELYLKQLIDIEEFKRTL